MQTIATIVTIASVIGSASFAHAAYATPRVVDETGDCGADNSVAYANPYVRMAWSCAAPTMGLPRVRVGSVSVSTAGYPIVSVRTAGFGSQPDIASNGAVVYINLSGDLIYARPVTPGTGDCGTDDAFECEVVPSGPGAAQDPDVLVDPFGGIWIAYRSGRSTKLAKRSGIGSYASLDIYVPQESTHYADSPLLSIGYASTGSNSVWFAQDIHQGAFNWVGVEQVPDWNVASPCSGASCAGLVALHTNPSSEQPTAIIDELFYYRNSNGTWSNASFMTTPEYATGLSSHGSQARISRGGPDGLRVTKGSGANWTSSVADGSVEVHRSSMTTLQSTGRDFIIYYDAENERLKFVHGT